MSLFQEFITVIASGLFGLSEEPINKKIIPKMEFEDVELGNVTRKMKEINNSEKYIKLLQQCDKIYINLGDITPSDDLIKTSNPLWGYYNVKSFTINNSQVDPCEIFPNHQVLCGDCFHGECIMWKKRINKTSNIDKSRYLMN